MYTDSSVLQSQASTDPQKLTAPPSVPAATDNTPTSELAPGDAALTIPGEEAAPSSVIQTDLQSIPWQALADGLELAELSVARSAQTGEALISVTLSPGTPPSPNLIILRVDPARYEFTLHMASEDGIRRSLSEHARVNGLRAVINAGMYLPDNLTSTGFMQSATHTNNPRIASSYGAFFMAEPDLADLPHAAMRDKNELGPELDGTLAHYKITVQNLRLFSGEGKILWPEHSDLHSISAMADDSSGRILFILCRLPLSPAEFSRILLMLPLECRMAMYLEGGSEAGLLVKMPEGDAESEKIWRGKHHALIAFDGSADAALPNVIGLRPRTARTEK